MRLKNVGPAAEMELEFGSRLNLITGDNGLGKSFILDVAWWALTRKWPQDLNSKLTSGYAARPSDPKKIATIEFGVDSKTKSVKYLSTYNPRDEAWVGKAGRPWNPGLVIYAHADGAFSVWDPARNYWKTKGDIDIQERLPSFVLSPKEVWDGLKVETGGVETVVCNGLLVDWANWIREAGELSKQMNAMLRSLSPSTHQRDRLAPGDLVQMSVGDTRKIPSLNTSYARSIPILKASAGVKRIVALCYMLLWARSENLSAAKLLGEKRANRVIFLIDELESHLHPKWQRSILGSLLRLSAQMHSSARLQIIAATHSPLVLASAEPTFDESTDAWFDLDLSDAVHGCAVGLRKRDFVRLGDVTNWLQSVAFDLKEARSLESEAAISFALELVRSPKPEKADIERADRMLRGSLSDIDRFWVRWSEWKAHRVAK